MNKLSKKVRSQKKSGAEKIENNVRRCVKREEAADGRSSRLTCKRKGHHQDDDGCLKGGKEEFLPLFTVRARFLCVSESVAEENVRKISVPCDSGLPEDCPCPHPASLNVKCPPEK